MKIIFSTKLIRTFFILVLVFGLTSSVSAQSFNQTPVNMNGLSSILLSCQKYGGKSSDEWITEGVGRISGFTNKAVIGATRGIFGGTKLNGTGSGSYYSAVGGLFCGEKCKNNLVNKAIEKNEKMLQKLGAGSLIKNEVPVTDSKTVTAIKEGAKANVDATNKANADESKRETCTDAMAKFVIRKALDRATKAALTYINTGMGGAPYYVTDPSTYFENMYHDILNKNIRQSNIFGDNDGPYSNTKNLINNQVDQVIIGQVTGKTPNFVRNPAAVASNTTLGGFLDNAFNGGMGQYLNKIDNINRDFSEQKEYAQQELLQGRGFFSQKKCVEYAPVATGVDGERVCIRFEVITPGSVIASQADEITTSQLKQLETANKISDVMASIMDSFLNDWLNNGLRRTGNDPSATVTQYPSPYANSASLLYSTTGYNGGGVSGVQAGQYANGANIGSDFNISHTTVLADIMTTQNNFLYRALDSINANKKLVAQTGALDYCVPGPNPSWVTFASNSNDLLAQAVSNGEGFQAKPDFKNETFTTDRYGFNDPVTDSVVAYKPQIFKISPAHAPLVQSKQAGTGSGILDFACGLGSSIANIFGGNTSCDHTESWTEPDPTPSNEVADAFNQWFVSYANELMSWFTTSNLIGRFSVVDTQNSTPFIRGQVRAMVNQSDTLVPYSQQLQENIDAYDQTVNQAQDTINQMQDIYTQVLSIVKTARARHIATQAAQGVVVNQQCLDQNFAINKNTAGDAQKESDADTDPTVIRSQFAQYDFYQKLCNTAAGVFDTTCIPPVVKPVAKIPFTAVVGSDTPNCLDDIKKDYIDAGKLKSKASISLVPLVKVAPGDYRVKVERKVYADYYRSEQAYKIKDGGGAEWGVYKDPQLNLIDSSVLAKSTRPIYGDAVVAANMYVFQGSNNPAAVYQSSISDITHKLYNPTTTPLKNLAGAINIPWLPSAPATGLFISNPPRVGTDYLLSLKTIPMWLSAVSEARPGDANFAHLIPKTINSVQGPDPLTNNTQEYTTTTIGPISDTIDSLFKTERQCRSYSHDKSRFCSTCKTDITESDRICSRSIENYIPKKVQYVITITDNKTKERLSVATVVVPFEGFYTEKIPTYENLSKLPYGHNDLKLEDPGYYREILPGEFIRNINGGSTLVEKFATAGITAIGNLEQVKQTTSIGLCQN